jgi:biopolymer transport protein ExbD|tara:strand:+ start:719 stop:1228 length:510 start_codon:yes stop_codon:yes gene_type:complete
MNISSSDPETEMEMDMTPMIDVVFLLIIFFMIITDMSQKDLEELELPIAAKATEDKPDPDENRPILNIPHTGVIIVRREPLYNPELDDGKPEPYAEVKRYLSTAAEMMPQEPLAEGSSVMLPDDPLLVRADESTLFKHIQKVLELCGQEGIQIWKVQLAVSVPEDDDEN